MNKEKPEAKSASTKSLYGRYPKPDAQHFKGSMRTVGFSFGIANTCFFWSWTFNQSWELKYCHIKNSSLVICPYLACSLVHSSRALSDVVHTKIRNVENTLNWVQLFSTFVRIIQALGIRKSKRHLESEWMQILFGVIRHEFCKKWYDHSFLISK